MGFVPVSIEIQKTICNLDHGRHDRTRKNLRSVLTISPFIYGSIGLGDKHKKAAPLSYFAVVTTAIREGDFFESVYFDRCLACLNRCWL